MPPLPMNGSLQSKVDSVTDCLYKVSTISGETDRLLAEALNLKAALDSLLSKATQELLHVSVP